MPTAFISAARSVVGLVRSGNEDSALLHSRLLAVADGMGGHAGGEVASSIAIKTLSSLTTLLDNPEIDSDSIEDLLLNSLDTIDSEINRSAKADFELTGMGTTLTALMLYGESAHPKVALLHVGDSRCYRLRGNTLLQMSHDHTVLQELLDKGGVSVDDANAHPQRSLLTQAIMGEGSLSPVLTIFDVKPQDRFLICSDGLSGVISEKELKLGMKVPDLNGALNKLIDVTLAAGAPDNVTIILATVGETANPLSLTFLGAATDE